jgi:hypothetical protein
MVPSDYSMYFMTMAAVAATLFGLIFVAISIAPESIATASAPLERQVKAVTAEYALLNPLIISLFALEPHQQIGTVVIALSLSGLLNMLLMALILVQHSVPWRAKLRNSPFILVGFVLYGFETYYGVRLLQSPTDSSALNALADLLIIIAVFGVAHAWALLGIRQFPAHDWLSSFRAPKEKENVSHTNAAHAVPDSKQEEN